MKREAIDVAAVALFVVGWTGMFWPRAGFIMIWVAAVVLWLMAPWLVSQ